MTEKELMIIFGTETGNAEMVAEDAQRMAPDYGLNATMHDMDDLSVELSQDMKELQFRQDGILTSLTKKTFDCSV